MSQSQRPTESDRTATSRTDAEPNRCHRRCEDGSICTQIVPIPGAPCYHHSGQEPVDVEPSAQASD